MKRLMQKQKQLRFKWVTISGCLATALALFLVLQAIIRLNKDSAEVYKNPTEENKREFDVSLERVKALTGGIGTFATIAGGIVLFLNFRIAEDKQVTERFSKAVEQLGNKEQLQVRLGGIYSLERIAKDSPEDLWTIVELLSSFIREYAATRSKSRVHSPLIEVTLKQSIPETKKPLKLPTDVQAAFTVLDRIYKQRKNDRRIDLREVDLNNTSFTGVKLTGVNLESANLQNAHLTGADIRNADLSLANLSYSLLIGANFSDAVLNSSILKHGILRDAVLNDAILNNADLSNTVLDCASFPGADLSFAKLSSAHLRDANCSHADLSNADLSSAVLNWTIFIGARLIDTNFNNADLSHADLSNAVLKNTNLSNAILDGAIFNGAVLDGANLSEAKFNDISFNDAILLSVDFSKSTGLEREHLGKALLCNTKLPGDLEELANRDCAQLPQVFRDRYPDQFKSLEDAIKYVKMLREQPS